MSQLTAFDFTVLDWIRENLSCGVLDTLMPAVSFLGNAGWFWILLAVSFCASKKYRVCGVLMLSGMLLGVILGNGVLKLLVARDRPCWIRDTVPLLIAIPRDYSFPSGHTLASSISALIMLRFDKRIGIPACVLALLIAFSRLYLFVHFPSDVLAALLLGCLIAFCVWRTRSRLEKWLTARHIPFE